MTPLLLDTIVLIVMTLSIVIAFFRGFIKEVLTIVNLLVAAVAAYLLAPMLLPTAKGWFGVTGEAGEKVKYIFGVIPPNVMATFVSYGLIYFGVFIILCLAGMAISSSVKALGLGPLDRAFGMVFGALRGFLLVFVIYLPFAFFMTPEQLPSWARESMTVTVMQGAYKSLDAYLKDGEVPGGKEDNKGPVDPNSLRGKLKKMSDEFLDKANEGAENVTDAVHNGAEETRDILTDEERKAP